MWTASGAIADVNALLAGVTFTPALNFNSNFTIATSVSDGVAPAITGVKAMTGTAVNDAPTATNLSAAESYTEDTALNLTDIVVERRGQRQRDRHPDPLRCGRGQSEYRHLRRRDLDLHPDRRVDRQRRDCRCQRLARGRDLYPGR